MTKPCRMTLRYPIRVTTLRGDLKFEINGQRGNVLIESRGATTDVFASQAVADKEDRRLVLDTIMMGVQMDQCARECRNLWGPIWKTIWRYEWDANKEAMREEREKALAEYRKEAMGR